MTTLAATWPAQTKEQSGSGSARATRRSGRVPAVVYGGKEAPIMVSLGPRDVMKGLNNKSFYASVYGLDIGGNTVTVLPKAVQFHPASDQPIHLDFLRVDDSTMVTVEVPVILANREKCKGLKLGGVLNIVRHSVELVCRANAIPDQFEIDLSEYKINEPVKSSAIALPEGARFTITHRDFTIATIVAPRGVSVEDEGGAA